MIQTLEVVITMLIIQQNILASHIIQDFRKKVPEFTICSEKEF